MPPCTVRLCRNSNYWSAQWRDPLTGARKSQGLGRRDDAGGEVTDLAARMICTQLQVDLEAGRKAAVMPTLGQWIDGFLALKPGLCEHSADLYRACGERLGRFLGSSDVLLAVVTPLQAEKWLAWLTTEEGLAAGSVDNLFRQAKTIFRKAERLGIIPRSPFDRVERRQSRPSREWVVVDLPTFERLLEASQGPWRALLGLCRIGGLRVGEALRLTWTKVDMVNKRLTVVNSGDYETTKARTREVPLFPKLYELLFELSMADGQGERVLQGIQRGDLHRGAMAISARAHVEPWPRFYHTLRKNCETDLMERFTIGVVTDWLGNSPAVALQRYSKAKPEDYLRAAKPPPAPPSTPAGGGSPLPGAATGAGTGDGS
jgi:integrase